MTTISDSNSAPSTGKSDANKFMGWFFAAIFLGMLIFNQQILDAIADSSSGARTIVGAVRYDALAQWYKLTMRQDGQPM
jgi:hypothetical protein